MSADVPPHRLRQATADDLPMIQALVTAAYAPYVVRLGKPPGPMLDDYAARVAAGEVRVLEAGGTVAGLLVLLDQPDHLLLDNVAVDPGYQGRGLGRVLLEAAEAEARRRGRPELRLYTHALMTENQSLYRRHGWEETHRGEEAGYHRIYFRKAV